MTVSADRFVLSMALPLPKPPRTALDYQLSFKRLDAVTEIIKTLIQCGTLVAIMYFIYLCAEAFAGKSTFANVGIRVLGNIKVSDGIIAFVAGSGWIFGLGQRSLRRKNIERIVSQKNALETLLDPNRTSSNLTPRGTTPPKRKR